jgi:hypothetical protein
MTTTTTTPILNTHPHSRRFLAVALAFGAGAALGVAGAALTTDDHTVTPAPGAESAAAIPSRAVAEHFSVAAIDHRDRLALSGVAASGAVAEHGSVAAIDHRDRLALSGVAASRAVAEHGSVTAIDHRDVMSARDIDS